MSVTDSSALSCRRLLRKLTLVREWLLITPRSVGGFGLISVCTYVGTENSSSGSVFIDFDNVSASAYRYSCSTARIRCLRRPIFFRRKRERILNYPMFSRISAGLFSSLPHIGREAEEGERRSRVNSFSVRRGCPRSHT